MITLKKLCFIASFTFVLSAGQAYASITQYIDTNVGGFVPNSAFDTPSFLSAIGTPDEFISFSVDKNGNGVSQGIVNGSIFSDNVVFSSGNSFNVNQGNGNSGDSEIGSADGFFAGVLNIDFLAAGQTASIVGFGPIDLSLIDAIRVYDQSDSLILTRSGVSNNIFDFLGLEGTGGTEIGRVELEGNFFAIQDIQFDLGGNGNVPEPTSLIVWSLLGAVCLKRRKH
jgi:hypothetical protein